MGPEILRIHTQAAEILLMMRPETEVPSDFQDYTLVTVVSVAAHLSGHELGDKVLTRQALTISNASVAIHWTVRYLCFRRLSSTVGEYL